MKRILVTGGAGFIGSHTVKRFVKLGFDVVVVDNLWNGINDETRRLLKKTQFIKADLADEAIVVKLSKKIKKVDLVYHLAALPRIGRAFTSPYLTHQANVTGTLNVLKLSSELQSKRLVYISSSSIYGTQETLPLTEGLSANPLHPYASQKYMGELYCKIFSKVYNLPVTVLRLFNVYGPGMPTKGDDKLVFSIWLEALRQNTPILIHGDGNQTRDFTYVDDVVESFLKILRKSSSLGDFDIFNICSGQQISINNLAKFFGHPVKYIPPRYSEKLEERHKQGSFEKAKNILDWTPKVSIKEGVRRYLQSNAVPFKGLIVVPAFNEEKVIASVVKRIPRRIGKFPLDVVVINDGSSDNTEKIVKKLKVPIISHPINRGLGAALESGFEYARRNDYNFLVTLDGDGQHDPEEISRLIKPVVNHEADFVVGNRMVNRRKMPLTRRAITFLASLATYTLTGVWTNDSQSGFRVFSKRAIHEISIELDRMEVSTDFFAQSRNKKLRILELPIKPIYTRYSLSKGQDFLNSFNILGKLTLARIIK